MRSGDARPLAEPGKPGEGSMTARPGFGSKIRPGWVPGQTVHCVGPTIGEVALRVLRRFPDRIAFSWDGGSLSYRAALELIGRFQRVYAECGLSRGQRIAVLTGNSAEPRCAAIAAQASGLGICWLHPVGSIIDQLFQINDMDAAAVVVDAAQHAGRGGELAAELNGAHAIKAGPGGCRSLLISSPAGFAELIARAATPARLAGPDTEVDFELFATVSAELGDHILGPPGTTPADR